MPGNKCSNCAAYNFECKYEEAAKVCRPVAICLSSGPNPPRQKRGPPKGCVDCSGANLYLHLPTFCIIKVCGESRIATGKNGEPSTTSAWSSGTRLCYLLIVSSYVPTPTLRKN